MKPIPVVIVPVDKDRTIKIKLYVAAPDRRAARIKALVYANHEFAPVKYKLHPDEIEAT